MHPSGRYVPYQLHRCLLRAGHWQVCKCQQWLLTANFGGNCGIHAELFSFGCFDQDTGKMWADQCEMPWDAGCRASWCDRPWCYVNPCTSVTGIAASLYFPGSALYYSYANSKSVDTFTPAGSSVDIAAICPAPATTSWSQRAAPSGLVFAWFAAVMSSLEP